MKKEDLILLSNTLDKIMLFRDRDKYRIYKDTKELKNLIVEDIPYEGTPIDMVEDDFNNRILQFCVNDTSVMNMGFPDCGNETSALVGTMYSEFIQQNLINQSESSPSITFAEISVIRWMRHLLGYSNCSHNNLNGVYDVGGIVTFGGTVSNCIAMMLARENKNKDSFHSGVTNPEEYKVIVPEDIGHYSINASLNWLGLGDQVVTVKSKNFKIDKKDLKEKLIKNKGNVMACVIYAGDSRSMTIDDFKGICRIIREIDPNIWIHADACHGFVLSFSNKYAALLEGINECDSITTDPHKTLMIPYGISCLLVKDPNSFRLISSSSYNLVFDDDLFAFGRITPFIGSKNSASLKLWFLLKCLGVEKIGEIIDERIELTQFFYKLINSNERFITINEPEMNSVMFCVKPLNISNKNIEELNRINYEIFKRVREEGKYYIHSFEMNIQNKNISSKKPLRVLRFMSGNPQLKKEDIEQLVYYIEEMIKGYE